MEDKLNTKYIAKFEQIDGLGSGSHVAICVKGVNSEELLMRRREHLKLNSNQIGFGELSRDASIPTPVFTFTLGESIDTENADWQIFGTEPRDIAFREDITIVTSTDELLVIDTPSGNLIRTIRNAKFKNIHNIVFSSKNPSQLLLSSSGLDRVIEIDIWTEEIVYEWVAWEYGFDKNLFGMTILDSQNLPDLPFDSNRYSLDEALLKFQGMSELPKINGEYSLVINPEDVTKPLGVDRTLKSVHPNWVGYGNSSAKLLATFFQSGQAVEIDRDTGVVTPFLEGLKRPHGVVPYLDGYIVTDTGNGKVIYINSNLEIDTIYDFTGLPYNVGEQFYPGEWLQLSYPIYDQSLIATIDSRRDQIIVWDPIRECYSCYEFSHKWIIHCVLPVPVFAYGEKTRNNVKV